MKTKICMALISGVFVSTTLLAQTASSVSTSVSKPKKSFLSNAELTLETESYQKKGDNGILTGSETFLKVEPGYKFNKKLALTVGTQYTVRENKDSTSESKNRDHLDHIFAKLLFKAANYKNNGIADLRLQARVYKLSDPFFEEYYGSDGDYQLRAYFGRPLIGKLFINKYTSYVRYKKYDLNSDAGDRTREYELRMRVSPTYSITDSLEVAASFTYNHIFTKGTSDAEAIEVSPALRYAFSKGKYAALLRADIPLMTNEESKELESRTDSLDQLTYSLNFAAYL